MRCRAFLVSVLAIFFLSATVYSQTTQAPNPKPAKPQFFAGQVIEADSGHVKVSRILVGRPPETRIFLLDGKTKTPKGGIKPKTRVTVRYEHLPEHDLALEIEVRPAIHTPKPT